MYAGRAIDHHERSCLIAAGLANEVHLRIVDLLTHFVADVVLAVGNEVVVPARVATGWRAPPATTVPIVIPPNRP